MTVLDSHVEVVIVCDERTPMGNSNSDGVMLLKPGGTAIEDEFSVTLTEKALLDELFTVGDAPDVA